ncbi:hypothetical protein DFH09DRAFT_1171138 [Mycena vulgaris]|nr:hypothetical protein DFH09DRAFT_1171138 [Mycena vulgaris]
MQSSDIESSDVAIFWDYENCHASSQTSGYEVAAGIRNVAHRFGSVKHFKAYMELPDSDTFRSLSLRSELQSSGVSLTDCPHNGRKNVADQMIMVDMLAYAMDHPTPATLILISVLRLRRYQVVVISLPMPGPHISLKSQASVWLDWNADAVAESTAPIRSPSSSRAYFGDRDGPFSGHKLEPAAKPFPASNDPRPIHSTPSSPAKPTSLDHPRGSTDIRDQPEVVCVPAPAYSANMPQIPKNNAMGVKDITTPVASTSSSLPQRFKAPEESEPTAASPIALFSESSISADILRCTHSPGPPAASSAQIFRVQTPRSSHHTITLPSSSPTQFALVESLEKQKAKGIPRPLRSTISVDIIGKDKKLYKKAGVEKFSQFVALAEKAKIIELGGREGHAWISLHPDWCSK